MRSGGPGWTTALVVVAMIAVIVLLDVILLRHHFWARLLVNVGIVLIAGGLYLRFRGR